MFQKKRRTVLILWGAEASGGAFISDWSRAFIYIADGFGRSAYNHSKFGAKFKFNMA